MLFLLSSIPTTLVMPSHTDLRLGHVTCFWTLTSTGKKQLGKAFVHFYSNSWFSALPVRTYLCQQAGEYVRQS